MHLHRQGFYLPVFKQDRIHGVKGIENKLASTTSYLVLAAFSILALIALLALYTCKLPREVPGYHEFEEGKGRKCPSLLDMKKRVRAMLGVDEKPLPM